MLFRGLVRVSSLVNKEDKEETQALWKFVCFAQRQLFLLKNKHFSFKGRWFCIYLMTVSSSTDYNYTNTLHSQEEFGPVSFKDRSGFSIPDFAKK